MIRNASSKDALIPLLNRYYEDIRQYETESGLWAGPNDYRPRIEIFHDAVRAYTSGVSPYTAGSRLSLEWLAWDVDTLRRIQANPLMPLPGSYRQSVQMAVAMPIGAAASTAGQQADQREVRIALGGLYGKYAVLFVALLAEMADMNYQSRRDEQDMLVEQLAELRRQAQPQRQVDLQQLAQQHIVDPSILAMIGTQLPRGQRDARQAIGELQQIMQQADQKIAGLEQLHTTWLSGQLALYEQGKPLVQALLREGMNVAGKFLQEAMAKGPSRGGRSF
jgi:hypothetical protein